jgi:hypothetical protein
MNHELLEFQKASTFSVKEINDLYYFFKHISVMQEDDGVIDFQEFCVGIGLGLGCLSDYNATFTQIIESE